MDELGPSLSDEEKIVYNEVDLNSSEISNKFKDAKIYKKFGEVNARQAKAGEEIETVLADGTKETKNVANEGDFVVTNPQKGETWIIAKDKFVKKYEEKEVGTGVYKPKGEPVKAILTSENIRFKAPWGEEQKIKAGGYIIESGNERYGNAKDEFESTYAPVEMENENK